jgi:capsular exopolysaccharide synthesis family protein
MSTLLADPASEQPGGGLRSYLDVVRRRKWLVLTVTAVAVALAVLASVLQHATYRGEEKIVIGQGPGLFQVQNGNAIQPFTATMSDLMHSNVLASTVIGNLKLDTTPEDLLKHLSTSINPQTAVILVHYDDSDKKRAVSTLQEIGLVFAQLVKDKFGQTQPAAPGATPQPPITATVFDPAHLLPGKVSPKPVRNVVIALILGAVLGLLGAFLREHFDRALRTRDAVERAFGMPVIGQVPFERGRGKDERRVVWSGFGEIAEAYRTLRTNLQYLSVQRPLRTILITSPSPEQGKTTVTANLAVSIARSGASTIVVEADLRRPRLDDAFGAGGAPLGVTSVLVGATELDDAAREILPPPDERGSPMARLALLASGPLPPNPSELLSSAQMQQLLDRLSATYDYVLIDSPPLLLVSDALEVARHVDGVVLVVRRDSSTEEAKDFRALVDRLGVHLLGVVMTDVEPVASYGTYGSEADHRGDGVKRRPPKPAAAREREREREPAEAVASEEV